MHCSSTWTTMAISICCWSAAARSPSIATTATGHSHSFRMPTASRGEAATPRSATSTTTGAPTSSSPARMAAMRCSIRAGSGGGASPRSQPRSGRGRRRVPPQWQSVITTTMVRSTCLWPDPPAQSCGTTAATERSPATPAPRRRSRARAARRPRHSSITTTTAGSI